MGIVSKRSMKFTLLAVVLVAIVFVGLIAFESDDSDADSSGNIYPSGATTPVIGQYSCVSGLLTIGCTNDQYQNQEVISLDNFSEAESVTSVEVYGFKKDVLASLIDQSYSLDPELYYKGTYSTNPSQGEWEYDVTNKCFILRSTGTLKSMVEHTPTSSPFYSYFFRGVANLDVVIEGYPLIATSTPS